MRFILAILVLGMGSHVFAEEFQQNEKEWCIKSLFYLEQGNTNLLLYEPYRALENFQKATIVLDKSDRFSYILSFLISFGEAIAYDAINSKESCKESLNSLFLAVNEYEERCSQTIDGTFVPSNEYEESVDFLRNLSHIAPSSDVRDFLLSLVNEMAEELLPAFKLSDQSFLGSSWDFDYGQDASIYQCKSFWKKVKHFIREAAEVIKYVAAGLKAAKDIKHTYDTWNDKGKTHR